MSLTTRRTENLTQSEKYELIRKLATHVPNNEIAAWLVEINKPAANISTYLQHYRNSEKHRPLIEKIRAQYEAGLADIAVTSKRFRLFQYQLLFDRLKDEGKYELAAKMLERCQGEVEGKAADGRPNIFITQFNQLSDSEIEERKLAIMQKIERLKNQQKLQLERGGYEGLRTEETKEIEAKIIEAETIDESST